MRTYVAFFVILTVCGWNIVDGFSDVPNPYQYHIQTDEGPERFFRYETLNGQFRKEKRLKDGTVIGTYAWMDADGILRREDYVADSAGYRIVNSKSFLVGNDLPLRQALFVKKLSAISPNNNVNNDISYDNRGNQRESWKLENTDTRVLPLNPDDNNDLPRIQEVKTVQTPDLPAFPLKVNQFRTYDNTGNQREGWKLENADTRVLPLNSEDNNDLPRTQEDKAVQNPAYTLKTDQFGTKRIIYYLNPVY